MLPLALLPAKIYARLLTSRFTVRIHSSLAEYRWAKLWYFLRGLDYQGSGFVRVPLTIAREFLQAKESTIYEWLRLGDRKQREENETKPGAFRRWRVSGGILRVALGSLTKVCLNLGDSWGITGETPLHEINKLRAHATGITAQKLQQRSRYAAGRSLPTTARRTYKLPQPDAFFHEASPLSDNSPRGSIPCLLHVGKRRIFLSKGAIPYGASQSLIAHERNVSDRTVRRHLNKIEMPRRQVVQAKGVYGLVRQALDYVVDFESEKDDVRVRFPDSFGFGKAILSERPGGIGKECHTHIKPGRIFRYGDKDWMYRCNLYKPVFRLKTMQYRQREYKAAVEAQQEQRQRLAGAELAAKLEAAKTPAPIPAADIINGKVVTLFHGHTTTSPRRGETTLCKNVENSFENFSASPPSAGEKDGHFP